MSHISCHKCCVHWFSLQAGIDVNVPNSYEQTALDIVHKFTRKAGAKEYTHTSLLQ